MRLRHLTLLGGIVAVLLPTVATAQDALATAVQPVAVETGPVLDTRLILPQIDERVRAMPERPENETVFLWGKADPNNRLKAGGLTDQPRVSLKAKFPGVGGTGWYPPDPDLAVGRDHAVIVVNSSVAFFRKSDGAKLFQQTAETFFSGLGATDFQFDPKVVYDPLSDRFFVLFLEQRNSGQISKALIAVSDDGDPNGSWYRYRIDTKLTVNSSSYWLDYPGFGVSRDLVGVCGNMFGFSSGYQGNYFVVLDKQKMLTGQSLTGTGIRDSSSSSVKLAAASDTAGLYGISVNAQDKLKIQHVTAANAQSVLLTVPRAYPPGGDVDGPGSTTLDSLDGRLFNAQWSRGGSLVASHNIEVNQSDTNVTSRWYDVTLNGWPVSGNVPSLRQSGNVGGGTGTSFHMPAVAKNRYGALAMVFTKTNNSVLADLMVTARKPSDPLGTMGAPTLVRSSVGNYNQFRWGDYFQMTVDPVTPTTFWGIGMVAKSGNWDTEFFTLTVPAYESGTRQNVLSTSTLVRQGRLLDTVPALVDLVDGQKARIESSSNGSVGQVASLVTEYDSGLTDTTVGLLRIDTTSDAPVGSTVLGYLWNYDTGEWDQIFTGAGGRTRYTGDRIEDAAKPYVSSAGRVRILTRTTRPTRGNEGGPFILSVDQQSLLTAPRE